MYGKRSKTNSRRSRTYTRRYSPTPYAKTIARIAKSVVNKQLETKENRYPHNNIGSSSFSSVSYGSGSIVAGLFGATAQGVGQGQRVGNAIRAIGVRINLAIQPADTYNNFRIFCVSPKIATPIQPSSTAAFVTNVLSGATSSNTQWLAPIDTTRYTVHFDDQYFLRFMPTDGNTGTQVAQTVFCKHFINLKNRKIVWDDNGVINNDVYLVAISDSVAAPNPGAIAGFVNCYFKDA